MSNYLQKSDTEIETAFKSLKTFSDVATLLEVSSYRLKYVLYIQKDRYHNFSIKKANKEIREISAPSNELKYVQKRLNEVLQLIYKPRKFVYGFIKEKSILDNAKSHKRKKYLLNIDLKDFFPSINFGRVRGLFISKPYNLPSNIATYFAQICCTDILPQGAPTSPIISNMICAKLDGEISRLATKYKCTYSRFADDITISTSKNIFPKELAIINTTGKSNVVLGDVLVSTVESNGFNINKNKITFRPKIRRQEVTGLIVNKKINIKREYIRQIRAMLHAWEKYGENNAETEFFNKYNKKDYRRNPKFRNIVVGRIQYVGAIRGKNDPIFINFCKKANSIEKDIISYIDYFQEITNSLWVLESDSKLQQGTGFALKEYGIITCDHVINDDTVAFQIDKPSKKYKTKVINRNEAIDLAIIEVENASLIHFLQDSSLNIELGTEIILTGYPNYRIGDSGIFKSGSIAGFRSMSGIRRYLLDTSIVAGNSGGPVLDKNNNVIGIAATGADSLNVDKTEHHSVIPVSALQYLKK